MGAGYWGSEFESTYENSANVSRLRQEKADQQHDLSLKLGNRLKGDYREFKEADYHKDPANVDAAKILYRMNTGADFTGTDEEAARYVIDEVGRVNYAFFHADGDAPAAFEDKSNWVDKKGLIGYLDKMSTTATDIEKLAFLHSIYAYDAMDADNWNETGRLLGAAVRDPTNWAGVSALAAYGIRFAGKKLGQSAAIDAIKNSLKVTAAGAFEGGLYGGGYDTAFQQAEIVASENPYHQAKTEQDMGQTAFTTGVSAVTGGLIPHVPGAIKAGVEMLQPQSPIGSTVARDAMAALPASVERPIVMTPENAHLVMADRGGKKIVRAVIDREAIDPDAPNFDYPDLQPTLSDDNPILQNTQGKFTQDGVYTPERQQLQNNIIQNTLQDGKVSDKPVAILMGGGGASGKGSILTKMQDAGLVEKQGFVHIDPDDIKYQLPEYKAIVNAGDHRAADVVHEESSDIANNIIDQVITGRKNMIIDRTMGNADSSIALIKDLKAAGYEVRLYGVTIDPSEAMIRALERYYSSGRLPPIDAMLKAHKGFNANLEQYINLVDEFELHDNSGATLKLLAQKMAGGELDILDGIGYHKITERGDIDEQSRTHRTLNSKPPSQGKATQVEGILAEHDTGRMAGSNKQAIHSGIGSRPQTTRQEVAPPQFGTDSSSKPNSSPSKLERTEGI